MKTLPPKKRRSKAQPGSRGPAGPTGRGSTRGRRPSRSTTRSKHQRTETELSRVNRALRAITNCNQVLMRATTEAELFQGICRLIVEDAGYRLAWVGLAEQDEQKTVRPVASAGYEKGYLEKTRITWADSERGRGPTGRAIRTGRPAVCRNVHTDPAFAPWRDEALRRGYASSLVLPLGTGGQVWGALNIYATEPGVFDVEETKLLTKLADDLVFGVRALRERAEHRRAEQALRVASAYDRNLIEASIDPLVTIGPEGKITDVNAATEAATGRTRDELIGTDFSDYFTEPAKARAGYQQAFREGLVRDYPLELRHRDGHLTSVLYHASVYRDEAGKVAGVFAAARDITERKAAEARLRASERQLSLIYANITDVVFFLAVEPDDHFRFISVNPAFLRATGLKEGQAVGRRVEEVIPAPSLPLVLANYREAIRNKRAVRWEEVSHYPSGTRWGEVTITPVCEADGSCTRLVGVVHDLTERRKFDEAMRRSEEELKNAQRVARLGSWWMDSVTGEVAWTEELFRMFGLDPAATPPPYPEHHRLFAPESWQRLSTALARTQATGDPYELELETVRTDGTHGWMLARGEPLRNTVGAVIGLRGIALDITERKRAVAALEESERSFRTLAESVPQIVWATRPDGGNIYFNQRWVDYTGMTLEESYGDGWNIPFHPDDQKKAMEAWQQATRHGAAYSLEVRLRRADGIYRWWLIRGAPLLDAAGNTIKWFGTCTDIHDLKQAEEEIRRLNADLECRVQERTRELAASEERMRSVLQSSAMGTFEVDLVSGEGRWNAIEFELLGLKPGEVPGTPETFFRYVRPDDSEALRAKWAEALRTGELDAEFRIVRADGEERWLAGKGRFAFEGKAGGRAVRFLGVNFDITARKKVEEELRRSESLYRGIGESIDYGIWVCTPDGRNLYASDSFLKLVGLTQEQCSNFGWSTVLHPDDAEHTIAAWRECVRTRSRWDIEHRFRGVDGKWHPILARGVPVLDEHGQIACWAGINLDISQLKQTEDALRASEARFKAVAASTPDHLLVQDRELRYTMVINPQLNLTEREMLGKTDHDFLAPAEADRLAGIKRQVMETGQPVTLVTPLTSQNGTTEFFEGTYVPKIDAAGRIDGLIGYFRNVTERKRTEEEILKLNEALQRRGAELEAANRELETFSYSVSHDLRAPLRAIDGFSRILLEDCAEKLDAEDRDHLQRVRAASQRMGRLIDDLLTLSRTTRLEMRRLPVDLSALAGEVAAELQRTEPDRRVRWVIAPGLTATGDPSLLRLALENLLGNAWKFTCRRPEACIEFGLAERDGAAVFQVRDNGAGFDMTYAGRLFSPFQRLHTTDEFTGNGIGLATVQRIVHRHGGRVWAEGRVDQGAAFCFTLPEPPPL